MRNTKQLIIQKCKDVANQAIRLCASEEILIVVYVDKSNQNILRYEGELCKGTFKIFDATGSNGAYNLYENCKDRIIFIRTERELAYFVFGVCLSGPEYSLMDYNLSY